MSSVVIAGLPSLAAVVLPLVDGDVRSAPPGRPLHEIVSWSDLPSAVIVAGSTPEVSTEAEALHREGCPVVIVNDGGPAWVHPAIPSITPPFSPVDVLAVVGLAPSASPVPVGAKRGYGVGPVPKPSPSGAASAWPRPPARSGPGAACLDAPEGGAAVVVASAPPVGAEPVVVASAPVGEEVPAWIQDPGGSDGSGAAGGPGGWERPEGFGADRGWGDRRPSEPAGSGSGGDGASGGGGGDELWSEPAPAGGGHGPWSDPDPMADRWEDADRFEEAWISTHGSEEVPWGSWGPEDDPPAPMGEALGVRPPQAQPVRTARRRDGRPQVLMWTCPKGGSGKTSLSLRYAAFLASTVEPSRRVVWVDGNLQQADGARYLGADERVSRTILDLAERPDLDERDVLASLASPSTTGRPMWSLFGPALKADADPRLVTPELYRDVVTILRRHFDHLVVDTPVAEHHNRFFAEFVVPEADQLVVVVPPLLPVVRAVREWLELQSRPVAAGGSALPAASVRVVLNMADERNGCPIEAVRDAWLARWTWAGHVPHDPSWTEATNNGSLFSERDDLAAGFADLLRATTGDIVERQGSERTSRWFRPLGRLLRR